MDADTTTTRRLPPTPAESDATAPHSTALPNTPARNSPASRVPGNKLNPQFASHRLRGKNDSAPPHTTSPTTQNSRYARPTWDSSDSHSPPSPSRSNAHSS